jgi:hypothetical protein
VRAQGWPAVCVLNSARPHLTPPSHACSLCVVLGAVRRQVVNVSVLLAAEQHKHPHDAIFLKNGDMVVGTWAPGRISYWKLLPAV